MVTITISATVGTPPTTLSKTFNLSDADFTGKLEPWMLDAFPGTPKPKPPAMQTLANAFPLWATSMMSDMTKKVLGWQRWKSQGPTPPLPISIT